MDEQERSRREALGSMLVECASSVESATVGIVSLLLPVSSLDDKTVEIRRKLLDMSHELRQIAVDLVQDDRKRERSP